MILHLIYQPLIQPYLDYCLGNLWGLGKNLDHQRHIQKATMIFTCLYGFGPEYLVSMFSERNTNYNLRDSENKFDVRLPRTTYFKNSFSNSGASLWNSLPCEATSANSLRLYKRTISKVLQGPAFTKRIF